MTDLFAYLKERPYPGRGILLGATPGGKAVCAYFIMGRSENSRNRVFEKTADGIRTRAWDESKMTDPSLIIYHPVRRMPDGTLIVTNGDQTDTVRDFLAQGKGWLEALCSRTFEPDEPNWTPRVSGLIQPCGSHLLSILRAQGGKPDCCERFFYTYDAATPGVGHFISTYEGFGSPLPSYHGEPVTAQVPDLDATALAQAIWDALDAVCSSGYYPIDDIPRQLDRIEPVVRRYGKPFFFAEAGCMRVAGSARVPNDWTLAGEPDDGEQDRWYRALFAAVQSRPWFGGAALWDWPLDAAHDSAYSFCHAPALDTIRQAWQRG